LRTENQWPQMANGSKAPPAVRGSCVPEPWSRFLRDEVAQMIPELGAKKAFVRAATGDDLLS
jgi:hypothetical protein